MALTMYSGSVNSPSTKLAQSITINQTTLELEDASVLPLAPNIFTIGEDSDCETVLYNSNPVGNTITVQRGFQGIAKQWDIDTPCSRNFTEYDYRALIENIIELQTPQIPEDIIRNASGYIVQITKGDKTYIYTRDLENNIISIEVI